jgi:hypothetical protein
MAAAMHAMQTTVATTLGSTPGALAFSQDMFLNMLLIADWQAIARTCEHHVNENLRHANRKRCLTLSSGTTSSEEVCVQLSLE